MYKLIKSPFDMSEIGVFHLASKTFIPFAPDNTDYQVYLVWLAEGNQPTPADEET